jgi:hypothetical protein
MKSGSNSDLGTAGSVVGGIGSVGSGLVKVGAVGSKPLIKNLSKSQKGLFNGIMGSIGQGLKTVGGLFSTAVKLAGKVADRDADKLDKDANVDIALQSLKLVKQAADGARGSLRVATKFNDTLSHDPGFAAAIPGVSLVSAVIGFVGNVVAVVPPTERFAYTTSAERDASKAGNNPLAGALSRTTLENKLMISTEIVGAAMNGARIGLSIAELASAGGMGVPAALKIGTTAIEKAKDVADFITLETMRSKTQDARRAGILQIEGSGKKLIKTDITYAVDTVILAAKKALKKLAEKQPLTEHDKGVLLVLESYGIPRAQAARLSLAEMHEKMLDKLEQDDEQATIGMKL